MPLSFGSSLMFSISAPFSVKLILQVESLKTQLQFKEMELMQAHSASQNHLTRLPMPTTPSQAPATPQKRPGIPGSYNANDMRDSEMFPTQQTFMADNPKADIKCQLRSPRLKAMSEGLHGLSNPRQSPRKSPRRSSSTKSPGESGFSLEQKESVYNHLFITICL